MIWVVRLDVCPTAVPSFYIIMLQVQTRVPVRVKTGGTAVGVAYWFTMQLYGEITISTYQPDKVHNASHTT